MLNTESDNLYLECKAAEHPRNRQLEHFDTLVSIYSGTGRGRDYWPENHPFEWLSLMLAKLIYDNPRVKVVSQRATPEETISRIDSEIEKIQEGIQEGMVEPGQASFMLQQLTIIRNKLTVHNVIAKAMHHGMNRWIKSTRGRNKLLQVAYDMAFGYGVMMTSRSPVPGSDPGGAEPEYWPQWQRLSPKRFAFDPLCLWFSAARYAFHLNVSDIEDLQNRPDDEGWNKDVLKGLKGDEGIEDLRKQRVIGNQPSRNEVAYYEIWVPEEQLEGEPGREDGFHGSIHTILHSPPSSGDKELREPRMFYGPPQGPYTLFGTYQVPDCPYPLSPLEATYKQGDELNMHVRSVQRDARNYKNAVFVKAGQDVLAKAIREGKHHGIYGIPELDKDGFFTAELFGITDQQLKMTAWERERLDRASGLTDTERGNVEAGVTATADAIASEAGVTRVAFIKQQFADGVQQALEGPAWHLYHDDETTFPLGADAAKDLRMLEPVFRGGSHEEGSGARYEDLELEIEPYSMGRVSEAVLQKRLADTFAMVTGSAPIMAETPFIDWRLLWDQAGDATNQPHLGDLIDEDLLEEMTQVKMASQQQGDPMLGKQAQGGKPQGEGSNTKRTGGPTSGEQQGSQSGATRKTG